MADSSINPYVDILQFDPNDCPPDHYALLGLPRYTSDPKQITAAAAEQIRYVRPFCVRYPTEATQLLNEITKAKLCLLDDDERAAYDASLRQAENIASPDRDVPSTEQDSESFADVFGDELDAAAQSTADDRPRRCPHCGSGLFENDEVCASCTGGLAHRAAWNSARCPECREPLERGAVVCSECDTDLSISDVIGCIPPHVPGTIKPFECRNRKQLRAERKRAMKAWRQGSPPKVAEVAADGKASARATRQRSVPSFRMLASIVLLAAVPLLGLYVIVQLLASTSDRSASRQQVAGGEELALEESPAPEIRSAGLPIEVKEGDLLKYRPEIANLDRITGKLSFQSIKGKLPPGCSLDEATGELLWTPTETQGPGRYRLELSCHPAAHPAQATTFAVDVNVVEANSPPHLDVSPEATAAAGATLEQRIGLVDEDFPANRISLELKSGPPGAVVDEIGKLLYWEIPANWQEPRVEFTVVARDDGTPPLTTSRTLVVAVTDIQSPRPKKIEAPQTTDRVPEVAVDLPPLPRPGEAIEPLPLEFELDPPVKADDVRLSLMLPDELRSLLKMRYLDDDDGRLAILLTNSFEPDDVPGNLSDGIVATCALVDSKYVWTWAMTKDLSARGYQNNIRHGVLAIESKSGGAPRLVALQKVMDVPAPTVEDMLGNEGSQTSLVRNDRIGKPTALEGLGCTADNGSWAVDLESQIDGFSLYLVNPELTERVNVRPRSTGMQFAEFGFRVVPHSTEIKIGLEAKPSPAEADQNLRAAKKSLIKKQTSYRTWQKRLNTARAQLASAQRLPEKNEIDRRAKGTKINQASRSIQQAEVKLAKLAIEIPADENLVAKMADEWEAIVTQLQPVRGCVITGELWRRIGDVRVPVLRLIPVELDVAEAAE